MTPDEASIDVYAGFGVHIQMNLAQAVACALIDNDRRHTGRPMLTCDELEFYKSEHTRLVATFG